MNERDDVMRETLKHTRRVGDLLIEFALDLQRRAVHHDESKFEDDEFSSFAEATPKLKNSTFGSDEYKATLAKIKPAIELHYRRNRHHPEYFGYMECNGCFKRHPKDYSGQCDVCGYGQFQLRSTIDGMTLVDLIEMLADWKAAGERHEDASIKKSIDMCCERFELSPQLKTILVNTAIEFGWAKP